MVVVSKRSLLRTVLRKHDVQNGKKNLFEAIHLQWKDLNTANTANYLFFSFPHHHPFVSA